MTYKELQAALEVFGLGNHVTAAEIKARHRELVKRHHPDSGGENPAMIREVNAAHAVLQEYVANYRLCFTEEEFYEQNPDERLRRQFMDDPLWGKGAS